MILKPSRARLRSLPSAVSPRGSVMHTQFDSPPVAGAPSKWLDLDFWKGAQPPSKNGADVGSPHSSTEFQL